MDLDLIRNNKIKKVKIFTIDKHSGRKDSVAIYYFNKEVCPYKKTIKLTHVKDPKWMTEFFSINETNNTNTNLLLKHTNAGSVKIYKKETILFIISKQKIKSISKEIY
jgi:hypothetical protein